MKIEPRWPVLLAITACACLNWLLPDSLSAGSGWEIVVLAVSLGALSWMTVDHGPRPLHMVFAYLTQLTVTYTLVYALVNLVHDLTIKKGAPIDLLRSAALIWAMNVLVFATWYWRLDAGGPTVRRSHTTYREGAFLFPQTTLSKETRELMNIKEWHPQFIDYLFLSFNASTAFSPTDSPVLSRWAKAAMMIQSLIAITAIALVAARAVNIL